MCLSFTNSLQIAAIFSSHDLRYVELHLATYDKTYQKASRMVASVLSGREANR